MAKIVDKEDKKKISHNKLLDKAKKLKALADRGVEGEGDSAKAFYKKFIEEHGIDEGEVNPQHYNRVFKLKSNDYEVLLSHIITSVNPFVSIKREKGRYNVILDDEDYIEVVERTNFFYEAFNREKKILFMAFMDVFKTNFLPDEQSVSKHQEVSKKMSEAGEALNKKNNKEQKDESAPEDRISNQVLDSKKSDVVTLVGRNAKKYEVYKKCIDNVVYMKANRRIGNKK